MKALSFFLLALLSCDNPQDPIITGQWEGTMYFCKRPVAIQFDLCQYGQEISGYFYSEFWEGVLTISTESAIKSESLVIVAEDTCHNMKYIFSGTLKTECSMGGEYCLVLYNGPCEDFWEAYKK